MQWLKMDIIEYELRSNIILFYNLFYYFKWLSSADKITEHNIYHEFFNEM